MLKKILNVVKVGSNVDYRTNESFAFPSCMTSLMQYLGEDYLIDEYVYENKTYINRWANQIFMAVTGMAFGLLWSKDMSLSSLDLTFVNPHDLTIKYAFDWAGYNYLIIDRDDNYQYLKSEITNAIDQNHPVLAFGIVGPPECSLITGYDNFGEILIGWSHFQERESLPKESNGMFRKANWFDNLWKVVLIKDKTARRTSIKEVFRRAIQIMEEKESYDYISGINVYDYWISYCLNPEIIMLNEAALKQRYEYHYLLVNTLQEARLKASDYLKMINEKNRSEILFKCAKYFDEIYNICKELLHVFTDYQEFRKDDKRKICARFLLRIKMLEIKALEELKVFDGEMS
ncbi:MAG: hypothetical protein GX490_05580 [Bacilli bacterium]|nr:hypothetical protein [Bacilli bacterium]